MKHRVSVRLLSLVLAVVMVLGCGVFNALAAGSFGSDQAATDSVALRESRENAPTITGCGYKQDAWDFDLEGIIDGSIENGNGTTWACDCKPDDHWFEIDLQSEKRLTGLELYHNDTDNGSMITSDFCIKTAPESKQYETVLDVKDNTEAITEVSFDAPKAVRYIRVEITKGNSGRNDGLARIVELKWIEDREFSSPLMPLPMLYLDMEDVSGNQVTNLINGQKHTVNGAAAAQGESVNDSKTLTFNGIDNSVDLGLEEYLPENEALTFAAWIKLQPNQNWAPVLSAGKTGDTENLLYFAINTQTVFSRFMLLEIREDNQQRMKYEANKGINFAEPPYDAWHHVAFSLSANEAKAYVDGKCVNTTALTEFPISTYAPRLLLGNVIHVDGKEKSDAWFKGDMDEVCLYDVTLTDDQIKALYQQGENPTGFAEVQLDHNDGSGTVDVMYAEKGKPMTAPGAVSSARPGYVFAKWSGWDFTQPVTGDVTLTAVWDEVGTNTVTFDTDGGSEIAPIEVTTGDVVERPEDPTKEGKTFVGWRLNGKLFDFATPITEDITLTAVWTDMPVDGALTIEAGQLTMVLDSYGRITSLTNKLNGEEYLAEGPDEQKSLLSLVADYEIETPAGLTFDAEANEITLEFPSIDAEAVVKLEVKENYTNMTLVRVEKPETVSLQAALWGPIKTKIMTGGQSVGTAYDDEFAIGLHMLNQKTIGGWPVEYPDYQTRGYNEALGTRRMDMNTAVFTTWGSALRAYSWDYTQDTYRTNGAGEKQLQPALTGEKGDRLASMIGSSVALYGTRPDNILNVISNIELTEGLPHPTIDGEWQRTSLKTAQDYLMFMDSMWDENLETIQNDIQMAKDAGIDMIYFRQEPRGDGAWLGHGGYILDEHLGGSQENAKKLVEEAEKNGIHLGTHTYSNLIRQDDLNDSVGWENYQMYLEDGPSALAYGDSTVLTRNVGAGDTEIYVAKKMSTACDRNGQRTVRIGNEIISFSACQQVSDTEWKLTRCRRGEKKTTAAEHKAGDSAYMLWTYHLGYHVGGWDSIDSMTRDMAEAYANTGMKSTSFDSFESNAFGLYGTLAPTEFAYRFYEQLKELNPELLDGFLADNSRMTSNVWDIQPRVGWGESGGSVTEMNKNFDYYTMNFTTVMLGWTYQSGTPNRHGGYGIDELSATLALKASANAGTQWMVNKDTFETYPHMPEMLKTWNNAIAHGAFVVGEHYTPELQAAMRESWSQWPNSRIWKLTETVPDQEWVLQEVERNSNLEKTIGEPVTLYATKDIQVEQPEDFDIATSVSREYFRAHTGDTVTVYAVPHVGKADKLEQPVVLDENGVSITLTPVEGDSNAWTFVMPDSDVTVTAAETADKSMLENLIDKAETLDEDDYTSGSWKKLERALDQAKAVYHDDEATQAEVDEAAENLERALDALKEKGNGIDRPIWIPGVPDEEPSWELPFTDVNKGDWFYESVYYAWDEGLINGVTAEQFQPDGSLTVAQAIKLASALHQLEARGRVTLENGTVNWYDTYVDYAVENGIIEAKYQSYTKAQMDAAITRNEFVHIFHGAMDDYKAINDVSDNAIPDVKLTDAYAAEIYDFYRAGILTGSDGAGTFNGTSTIKRSEVAAILIRMYDETLRQRIELP